MAQVCMPCGSVSVIELCSIKPPADPPDTLVDPIVVSDAKEKHYEIWSFYQKTCVNNNTPSTLPQTTETPTPLTDQPLPTTESYGTSTFFNISSSFPPIDGNQNVSSSTTNPVWVAVLVSVFALALCIFIIIVLCLKFKPDLLRKMRLPFQRKRGHDVCDPHIKYGEELDNGPKSPGAESVCSTSPLQENAGNYSSFTCEVEDGDNSGFVNIMINGETECVNANTSSVFFSNKITTVDDNIENNNYHSTVDNSPGSLPVQCSDSNDTQDVHLETCSDYKINELESQGEQNKALELDFVPECSITGQSEVKSEGRNKSLQPEAIDLVVPDDNNTQNNSLINNKLSHPADDIENMTLNGDHDGDSGSRFSDDGKVNDNDGHCNNLLDDLTSEDSLLETKTDFNSTKAKLELPDGLPLMDKFADFPVKSFGDSGYASRQISRQEST